MNYFKVVLLICVVIAAFPATIEADEEITSASDDTSEEQSVEEPPSELELIYDFLAMVNGFDDKYDSNESVEDDSDDDPIETVANEHDNVVDEVLSQDISISTKISALY